MTDRLQIGDWVRCNNPTRILHGLWAQIYWHGLEGYRLRIWPRLQDGISVWQTHELVKLEPTQVALRCLGDI